MILEVFLGNLGVVLLSFGRKMSDFGRELTVFEQKTNFLFFFFWLKKLKNDFFEGVRGFGGGIRGFMGRFW
jgi:hypothetical protein